MSLPRIGISGVVREWEGARRTGVNAAYAQAVLTAGGVPLILPPLLGPSIAARALDGIDGLLLTGGEDVDPAWYRAAPSPFLSPPSRERDLFELALFAVARQRELPILAICRGIQLVNVALGGTLYQDLPSERPGPVEHRPEGARDLRSHHIRLEPGSRAAAALGGTSFQVNSSHHQGIRDLAPTLQPSGWADDGLIEAVETPPETPWLLGVQWHPEEMQADSRAPERGLFAALVYQAGAVRGVSVGEGRKEDPVAHAVERAP